MMLFTRGWGGCGLDGRQGHLPVKWLVVWSLTCLTWCRGGVSVKIKKCWVWWPLGIDSNFRKHQRIKEKCCKSTQIIKEVILEEMWCKASHWDVLKRNRGIFCVVREKKMKVMCVLSHDNIVDVSLLLLVFHYCLPKAHVSSVVSFSFTLFCLSKSGSRGRGWSLCQLP